MKKLSPVLQQRQVYLKKQGASIPVSLHIKDLKEIMRRKELSRLLKQHQIYLEEQGGSIPLPLRIKALKQLKLALKQYEVELQAALKKDLGKHEFESYSTEIGFLYASIDYTLKNLKKWNRPRRVQSEVAQLVGTSKIIPSAYGVALIVGAFNYPVQLLFRILFLHNLSLNRPARV